jgi:triosephosphate isomerase
MNTGLAGARALARDIAARAPELRGVQVALFPPFPYLLAVGEVLADFPIFRLGAQDFFPRPDGAFTGEVSLAMLKDCGVRTVLAGHSERRHILGDSDDLVREKTAAALAAGFECILCIGETLDQRQAGQTDQVNARQLTSGLKDVPAEAMPRLTIAYEPVWAIGTGKTATPADAQDAHAKIRGLLASLYSPAIASATRIQYGGSVKASSAAELFAQPDIDGGLIGGASLNASEFVEIVRAASRAKLHA